MIMIESYSWKSEKSSIIVFEKQEKATIKIFLRAKMKIANHLQANHWKVVKNKLFLKLIQRNW